jgi:hypothetical protein
VVSVDQVPNVVGSRNIKPYAAFGVLALLCLFDNCYLVVIAHYRVLNLRVKVNDFGGHAPDLFCLVLEAILSRSDYVLADISFCDFRMTQGAKENKV